MIGIYRNGHYYLIRYQPHDWYAARKAAAILYMTGKITTQDFEDLLEQMGLIFWA